MEFMCFLTVFPRHVDSKKLYSSREFGRQCWQNEYRRRRIPEARAFGVFPGFSGTRSSRLMEDLAVRVEHG
jgi:hypothetical protein